MTQHELSHFSMLSRLSILATTRQILGSLFVLYFSSLFPPFCLIVLRYDRCPNMNSRLRTSCKLYQDRRDVEVSLEMNWRSNRIFSDPASFVDKPLLKIQINQILPVQLLAMDLMSSRSRKLKALRNGQGTTSSRSKEQTYGYLLHPIVISLSTNHGLVHH